MSLQNDTFRGLYGIADSVPLAEALLAAGVRVLQLRDKASDGRMLLAKANDFRRLTREAQALFIVNDRLDIALMAEADGVHLGQDDLPVSDVRAVAARTGRGDLVVGLSTHDLSHVRAAMREQVDYIGFGPVFATRTKHDALPARGLGLLREAVQLAGDLPVVAIGGVTLAEAAAVRGTGASMAAIIADVAHAADPTARAAQIHKALL